MCCLSWPLVPTTYLYTALTHGGSLLKQPRAKDDNDTLPTWIPPLYYNTKGLIRNVINYKALGVLS